MKETDFDISVRNILADAEEPVSPGVWKRVAAGIAPRRVLIPFWAYALSGAAAAAAIAVGVVLFRPSATVSYPHNTIAETPASIKTELPRADIVAPIEKQIQNLSGTTAYVEEEDLVPAETPAEESRPSASRTPVLSSKPSKSAFVEDDNAALNRLAFTEKKHEPWISFTAAGNVQSNNRGSFAGSRNLLPRAPQVATGEGIYNSYPESSFGLPFSVGIGAKFSFVPRWSIGTGIRYTMLSRTFVGDYYDSDLFPYRETDIDNNQHWIGIPVNLYYDIISTRYWHFHAFLGGAMELLVDNDYLVHASPEDIHFHQSSGYPPQLSAGAGVGVEFMFLDNVGVYFDPSIHYYFGTSKQPRSIRTVQPLRMEFEAGVRFYFGK